MVDPKDGAKETGVLIVGTFEGIKRPAPYEGRGVKGEPNYLAPGVSRPKLGVRAADGSLFQIVCGEETMQAFDSVERGSVVYVPVSVRAYGENRSGRLAITARGDEAQGGDSGAWD